MKWLPEMRPKIRPYDGRNLSPDTVIEVKYDGHLMTLIKERPGRAIRAIGKKIHLNHWTNLIQLEWLQDLMERVKPGTVIEGELLPIDGQATDIPTLLKERSTALHFQAFAVPYYWGMSLLTAKCETHREVLETIGFCPPKLVDIACFKYMKPSVKMESLHCFAEKHNLEGLVLKELGYDKWYKCKPVQTIDVVITGTKPGEGKHEGRLGAMIGSVFARRDNWTSEELPLQLQEITSIGKGGDEHWRDCIPGEVIGRVAEIAHEGVQSKGKLKFSRFIRWREDKNGLDCTYDQLT